MRRGAFLTLAAAALLPARRARAQSEADPASSATRQSLRVLLGSGDAVPLEAATFLFDGRVYRGDALRLPDGRVVNLVDLEAYLASVVPAEMPPSWPAAALQAQAICARTYVLERSDPRRDYDLVPSELDQVYRGVAGEAAAATAAVTATAGCVLHYGAGFARVAYSSCCGGRTESAADLWGGPPVPYLQGVLCTFCAASPNYRWSIELPLAEVSAALGDRIAALGMLSGLSIVQRDPSGRTMLFLLAGSGGSMTLAGDAVRRALGARRLRSLLLFSAQPAPDGSATAIAGGGLGHGVGLCQWGARGMALAGSSAAAILQTYFPATVAADIE